MTNYEKIKYMNIEEMAMFLCEIAQQCEINTECNSSCYGCDEYYCDGDCCLAWLKREIKEDNE